MSSIIDPRRVTAGKSGFGTPRKTAKAVAKPSAKYRDCDNACTGKGSESVWLSQKLAAGAKLDDFLVSRR